MKKEKLSRSAALLVILSGIVEENKTSRCENLYIQLQKVCGEERESKLLKKLGFHFAERGAFPYSREMQVAYDCLIQSYSSSLERVGWDRDMLVHPSFIKSAEMTRENTDITEKEYKFLRSIGRNIPVVVRYSEHD